MKIFCPSYNRPEVTTLHLMESLGIPISVLLHNSQQKEMYSAVPENRTIVTNTKTGFKVTAKNPDNTRRRN